MSIDLTVNISPLYKRCMQLLFPMVSQSYLTNIQSF